MMITNGFVLLAAVSALFAVALAVVVEFACYRRYSRYPDFSLSSRFPFYGLVWLAPLVVVLAVIDQLSGRSMRQSRH